MLKHLKTKEPSQLCFLNFGLDYTSVINLLSHERINCIKSTGSMLSDYVNGHFLPKFLPKKVM